MNKIFIIILAITVLMQNLAKAEVAMTVCDGMVCMACQAKRKRTKAATGEGNVEVSWPEGLRL